MLPVECVFLIYVITYIDQLTTWSQSEHNAGRQFLPFDRVQAKTLFCLHMHFKEAANFRRKWSQARFGSFFRRNALKSNAL